MPSVSCAFILRYCVASGLNSTVGGCVPASVTAVLVLRVRHTGDQILTSCMSASTDTASPLESRCQLRQAGYRCWIMLTADKSCWQLAWEEGDRGVVWVHLCGRCIALPRKAMSYLKCGHDQLSWSAVMISFLVGGVISVARSCNLNFCKEISEFWHNIM